MTTKHNLNDVKYILHRNKIHKVRIETITKTVVIKNGKNNNFLPKEEETYGLILIKEGGLLTTTNNVNDLYDTKEELLKNITIVE